LVAVTKYIILGLGILAATFFFKEAAGSSLTGTLQRTGLAGQSLGTGIGAVGGGIGQFGVRLLDPFFSLADLFSKFGSLFAGEKTTQTAVPSNRTPGDPGDTGGGIGNTDTGGGIADSTPTPPPPPPPPRPPRPNPRFG
jgi:hypothetical protein